MKLLKHLFSNNADWAERSVAEDPEFFTRLMHQQAPHFFWIGCSDSRVPSTQITGLEPGEIFVHRNVANLVAHEDLNCQSALQYAIEYLGVRHIIICGHYGCGGIRQAMSDGAMTGPIREWLGPTRDLYIRNKADLESIVDEQSRWDRLCELNVIEQVRVSCSLPLVTSAWERGDPVAIHGWIYSVRDGRLRDLNVTVSPELGLPQTIQAAPVGSGTA
jgi:carbonic anhydrase